MLVKDLIKELENLPQDATIGDSEFDNECENMLYDEITIYAYDDLDGEIAYNNNKCDYYVG